MPNGNEWEAKAREEIIWEMGEQIELEGNSFLEEEYGITGVKDFDRLSTSKLMEIAKRLDEICGYLWIKENF